MKRSAVQRMLAAALALAMVLCAAAYADAPAAPSVAPSEAPAASSATVAAPADVSEPAWGADRSQNLEETLRSGDMPSLSSVLARLALAMVLVLGLLVAGLLLLKRFGRSRLGVGGPHRPLRVADRLALGPKKQICLVHACGRYLLIGVTDKEMTLLTELTFPASGEGEEADFAALIEQTAANAPARKADAQ